MYAIRQYEFGPPETLRYEQVRDPAPAEGQVRIAVEASGVHLIDTAIRRGQPWGFPLPALPMVPGREVAGAVDEVGAGVDDDWVGRRVVAHLGLASGGYAERSVAAAAAVHEIPAGLAADAAVAAIGTGRTALAILDIAAVRAGEVVLVTGPPAASARSSSRPPAPPAPPWSPWPAVPKGRTHTRARRDRRRRPP